MKKINVLFFLLLCFAAATAQQHEPVNTKKDQRQFNGYTVRLLPASGGTYGYDVIQGNNRVIHQTQNPFVATTRGLNKKEDAFAVAQYQVKQLQAKSGLSNQSKVATATGRKLSSPSPKAPGSPSNDQTIYNQRLSPKVATQLKIAITQ